MRSRTLIPFAAGALLCNLAAAVPLLPEAVTDEAVIEPVTTRHRVRIGDTDVRYAATFGELLLADEQGKPQATISSTAYVREGVRDAARRPVLFLFNGGPGASSSPLHFSAFGPRRYSGERDATGERMLIDNSQSLIDAADLIFIDPVGTGFSRERADATTSGAYWSVEGDAQAALQLIRTWLREHDRLQSPLYIAGQSYGGFRLATMMKWADDLPVAGLILISPGLDMSGTSSAPGNDQPFILNLPSMAAAAWHHRKVERGDRTLEQFYDEAARFAQSEYAVALLRGWDLPTADRERIAARMSALIGLPADTIAADNLRIDSQKFLDTLLASDGLIVGRLDMRVTAPKNRENPNPDRPAAANDPALGLGRSNVIRSEPIRKYFQDELEVKTAREYFSLTLDVNFRWNWRGKEPHPNFYVSATANIAALMDKKPAARVLLFGGYFDLATPLLAPRHALAHAGVPLDRVTMEAFAAGHSPFEGDENRSRMADLARAFLRGDEQGESKPANATGAHGFNAAAPRSTHRPSLPGH